MTDAQRHIRLPISFLPNQSSVVAAPPQDDEQFAVRQVEFIQQLFGRGEYLRTRSRGTPVSDAFLSAFITLLDVLAENTSADEANQCVRQLRHVLGVAFPR
ncbi:hypothetical protein [Trinickia acidisoli]|uniref:hypothetical protein n=1 Tax=Trinickia acidisoli TaxID=2767482 RepID=UPI001A8D1F84|nr:hypothetical protein [Trinickia acidisoli]